MARSTIRAQAHQVLDQASTRSRLLKDLQETSIQCICKGEETAVQVAMYNLE